MSLFHKMFFCALLAAALCQSEVPAQVQDSGANPKARVPPTMPPVPPSPIDYFRKLLDASPAERERLLADKTAGQRRVLTNNIRAYLTLTPESRELRLNAMELRCHLAPLLQIPATNRAQGLAAVPDTYRDLVRERLAVWDGLSVDMQRQVTEIGGLPLLPPLPPMPVPMPRGFTSNQLRGTDTALARWTSYPEERRGEIVSNFQKIFEMAPAKKEQTLAPLPLSPVEREQMEKTLDKFEALPPAQRKLAFNSFKKFAELAPVERRQFLRNAEAWQAMSVEERERWRQIVNQLPPMPPLPPGFGAPPSPPTPTMPAPRSNLLVTNFQ